MYDSANGDGTFVVDMPGGTVKFMHHPCGLHYLDLPLPEHKEILMAMILGEQYEGYTKHQID